LQILDQVIPTADSKVLHGAGENAAGYGAPFATKSPEILECAALSIPDWKRMAFDPTCDTVAPISARTVARDPEAIAFLSQQPGYRGPKELGIEDCCEVDAFAFNPGQLLRDWAMQLRESGCLLRPEDVTQEKWMALLQGENPFDTDIAVVCCGTQHNRFEPGKVVPVRGVLAHFRKIPIDLSRVPVSAMFEDDLARLAYLVPRPADRAAQISGSSKMTTGSAKGLIYDLILGGTFDVGEGECTESYMREVMQDRLVRARSLFANVVPELIPILQRDSLVTSALHLPCHFSPPLTFIVVIQIQLNHLDHGRGVEAPAWGRQKAKRAGQGEAQRVFVPHGRCFFL
jgi:hypothetical protein